MSVAHLYYYNIYNIHRTHLDYETFETSDQGMVQLPISLFSDDSDTQLELGADKAIMSPDGSKLIFLGRNQDQGIGLWVLDFESDAQTPRHFIWLPCNLAESELSLNNCYAKTQIGHFKLFDSADGQTFTVQAQNDKIDSTPAILTYTWDGALVSRNLSSSIEADYPVISLEDGVLYAEIGVAGRVIVPDLDDRLMLTGLQLPLYPSNEPYSFGVAVGHLDDGTQNFTFTYPDIVNGELSSVTLYYADGVIQDTAMVTIEGYSLSYLFVATLPMVDADSATIFALQDGAIRPIVSDLTYRVNPDDSYTFPSIWSESGWNVMVETLDNGVQTYTIESGALIEAP